MKPFHIFLAVLTSVIWGLNFLVTKVGLQDFPPIFFTCLRYTAIAFPLVFFISREGLSWKLIVQTGIFLGTLTFTLAFIGIKLGVPAGLTSLLMQAQVLFTLLLSVAFLSDNPSLHQRIGLGIAFVGIAMLVWDFHQTPSFIGVLFVLAGALCSGISKIVMKNGGNYNTFRLMVWMSIVPPIPLLLLSLVFEDGQVASLMHASAAGYGAILFNAFISTIIGFGIQGYLIVRYSPNVVTPYSLLVPVTGLIGGYLLLGETFGLSTFISCVLVLIGLAYPRYAPMLGGLLNPPPSSRHPDRL
jgi:O-acetylserine/cysteine efflux transporter